jgi:acetyl/propionyl-CoA carboxylase alpha subunit
VKIDSGARLTLHESIPDGLGESATYGFRLLVAPAAGRLRHLPPARFRHGREWVSAGQTVALVEQGSVTVEVRSPVDARVAGILVRDGEPVAAGQPLVWLDDSPPRRVRDDVHGRRRS